MCRSIKTLAATEPPTTEADVRAAALQFVRKISGMRKPSRVNEAAFEAAVDEIAQAAGRMLGNLTVRKRPAAETPTASPTPPLPL